MQCELCGTETKLFKAVVEGTELTVCKSCAGHGKIIKAIFQKKPEKKKQAIKSKIQEPEEEELLIPNFAKKIRKEREKRKLKQEDFAKKINIKASLLHKIESGSFEPSLEMARKLERALGIRLIVKEKIEKTIVAKGKSSENITIGDLIKF